MPGLRKVWLAGALSAALPIGVMAQAQPAAPAPATPAPPAAPPAEEVGVSATDYFIFTSFTVSVPLRHDGLVPGSDKVEVDGKPLTIGEDYWIDRNTGRLYFRRIPTNGQQVIVSYRYEPSLSKIKQTGNLLKDFGFGNRVLLNYEGKAANGLPAASTIGFANNLGGGSTSITGMALFSNRSSTAMQSFASGNAMMDPNLDKSSARLILQSFKSGAMKLDYQDVSSGFTDFNSAADSGADGDTMRRLIKERGLKRLGFSINELPFGSGSISQSFRRLSDGDDSINWRTLGLKQKNFTLNWTSRTVNDHFWRFDDIAEADKDRLRAEAGLSRQRIDGEWKAGSGALSFAETDIAQADGNAIRSQSLDYKGKYSIKAGRQSVGAGFSRFDSLPDAEKNDFLRLMGTERQFAEFSGPVGKTQVFAGKHDIGSLGGMLRMVDLTLQSSTYAFRHHERNVAQSFNAFGNMSDADLSFATDGIGKIFNPGYAPNWGDYYGLQRGPGLNRSGSRLDLNPGKWKASYATMKLDGQTDGALYDVMNIASGRLTASMTRFSVDPNFNLGSVMDYERWALGNLPGLKRTDVAVHYDGKQSRTIDVQAMRSSTPNGGASRTAFVLKDPKVELNLSARKVDPGFSNVAQMLDPESNWLSQLIGATEQEGRLKFQPNGKFRIEAWLANASGGANQDTQSARDVSLNWTPDAKTSLEVVRTDHGHDGVLGPILNRTFDHVAFRRDFGKYGKLGFVEERLVSSGTQKSEADMTKQSLTYETRLNANTGFSVEETQSKFDDGRTEKISSQTISTKLTPKSGVSYTNTIISREGSGQKDEHRDSYGAWVEFKGGLKVEYGGARNLMDDTAGSKVSTFSVSQTTLGDINFGGNYNENRFDTQHTQSQGRVAISSAKPLRIGKLSDLKFTIGSDTQADWSNYSRDNRNFGLSGKWGTSAFGFEYRSALDPASNERGIDRSFSISTDPGEKAKFRGSFNYKVRRLPGDQQAMIRNFSLTARPLPKMEITHQLLTNPELSRPDAILGSVTQHARVNKWKMDYRRNDNFTLGGSFEESIYETNQLSRMAGLTMTLNEAKGSPFSFFIGAEALDTVNGRRAFTRYMLRYDPKSSENQRLSLFLGNVAYRHSFGTTGNDAGMTVRVDYTLKF